MYKVAILDDEKNFLEEIHNCLQEYEMFEVSYFQEAKLLIDEIDYFDVVYIDYEMENMTAFEFFKETQMSKYIRIIITKYDHIVYKSIDYDIFDFINSSNAKVVSIDTPSGTNSTDGSVINAVKADYTIAISTLKFAHVLPPSNAYCGKIYTVNIGIDEKHYESGYPQTITKKDIKKNFTKRDFNANKGSFGHQLNICGSYLMPGASVICAKAALKTGVGLLKCAFPKSIYPVMTSHLTQPLFKPLCENELKQFQ